MRNNDLPDNRYVAKGGSQQCSWRVGLNDVYIESELYTKKGYVGLIGVMLFT